MGGLKQKLISLDKLPLRQLSLKCAISPYEILSSL